MTLYVKDFIKSLNELNAFKLKFGCGSGDEEILLFKKSNLFNMSASEVFSEANLFGEIICNRNSKASINYFFKQENNST